MPLSFIIKLRFSLSYMSDLPYRPGVGMILINRAGLVFVAKRIDMTSEAWQMPQGGIDEGENPKKAAMRELKENRHRPRRHYRRKPRLADLRPAAGADPQNLGRALSRPAAEMVCTALYRQRSRYQYRHRSS